LISSGIEAAMSGPHLQSLDTYLARILRDERPGWPGGWNDPQIISAFRAHVINQRITGLLAGRIGELGDWPPDLHAELRQWRQRLAMWELSHQALLRDVLNAHQRAGIRVVVMKGTALAYSIYSDPASRFRVDSDLLIREQDKPASQDILARLGFSPDLHTRGLFGDYGFQQMWRLHGRQGLDHALDVHWEVVNSKFLAKVIPVSEVFLQAVPLERLAPGANASDPVTRLLHLCLHRALDAIPNHDITTLNYAYDIYLQASALDEAQWAAFTRRSIAGGIASVCHDALIFARQRLGSNCPQAVLDALSRAPSDPAVADYIHASSSLERTLADIKAMPGAGRKLRLALARMFPSTNFLREKYPGSSASSLPVLFVRRMSGALRDITRASQP
jgi:hypothetical protein